MRYWFMVCCLLSGAARATGDSSPAGQDLQGRSTLTITVDGPRMTIGLDGPVGNFIGFEHPPATPEQTAQLAMALDDLRAGNNLFLMPPEADCRMDSAAVSPPAYKNGATAGSTKLAVSWQFRCSNPEALIWVDAQVFANFPGTEKLATNVVTPVGQKAVVLTPGTPRVLLPRQTPNRD